MKAIVIRTAMCGGGLSYDVLVTTDQIPTYHGARHTTILRDRREFWDYVNATLPATHYEMPQGWERYQDYLAHEKAARREMLAIVRRVFPEASGIPGDSLPTLWTVGLVDDKETSAEVEVSL